MHKMVWLLAMQPGIHSSSSLHMTVEKRGAPRRDFKLQNPRMRRHFITARIGTANSESSAGAAATCTTPRMAVRRLSLPKYRAPRINNLMCDRFALANREILALQ